LKGEKILQLLKNKSVERLKRGRKEDGSWKK
jgi:hypothetical protein